MAAGMKNILLAIALIASTTTLATADDAAKKAEAQKKIDEAKVKGCEAFKGIVVKAKGCPDQSAAAAKVTCTVATAAEMNTLYADCTKAQKEKTDAKLAETKAKAAAPKDISCKAVDEGGASFYDKDNEKMTGCMKEVKAAAITAKCTAGVKKAKVTYTYASKKPLPMTVFCPKS
jgi:hypothetical protein